MDDLNLIIWSPGVKLEDIERQVILKAFRHYRSNKTQTAIALGISITTLDGRLKGYLDQEKKVTDDETLREQRRQNEWFRSRGEPKEKWPYPEAGSEFDARCRVESAERAAKESKVSVPKRQEVQGMSSADASNSGQRKTSRAV